MTTAYTIVHVPAQLADEWNPAQEAYWQISTAGCPLTPQRPTEAAAEAALSVFLANDRAARRAYRVEVVTAGKWDAVTVRESWSPRQ